MTDRRITRSMDSTLSNSPVIITPNVSGQPTPANQSQPLPPPNPSTDNQAAPSGDPASRSPSEQSSAPVNPPPVDLNTLIALLNANNDNLQQRQNATLLTAIEALTQPRSETKLEINRPEDFNGTNDKKLQPFFFTCELNFDSNPRQFSSDERKIHYAISFFTGTPLKWVQTQFGKNPRPEFLSDWKRFKQEVTKLFGNPDPTSVAATALDNIYMQDNHKATRFITDFMTIASELNWGDDVLEHYFFRRLPPRLRSEIIRAGHRKGFEELRLQALELDRNHWDALEETKATNNTPQAQKANKKKSDSTSKSNSSNSNSNSNSNQQKKSKTNKPDLSNILTSDKRLKPEERQRRIEQNLCLYCGKSGHKAPECNLRQDKVKARATTTEPAKTEASTTKTAPAPDATPAPGK